MNRRELTEKLDLVGHALAQADLIQILKCFTFNDGFVTAFNDQLSIMAECEVEETFAVNGKTLLGLLQASGSDDVSIKIGDQHDVVVKAGKSEFRLPYFGKDDFVFEEPPNEVKASIEIEDGNPITVLLETVSKDEATQGGLCGIVVSKGFLYSSNGDAITRVRMDSYGGPPYLVPTRFWELIYKYPTIIDFMSEWAFATLDIDRGIIAYVRTTTPMFNHENTIKKTLKKEPKYSLITDGLYEALARARVVADQESAPTLLIVKDNQLHLHTESSLGVVSDVLPFNHPDVTANVNAEMIQRSVKYNEEMAIMENCTCFREGKWLFQIVSNL